MAAARLYIIKGRVQGVFFRASTREVAESLGLTGHAIMHSPALNRWS